MNENKIKGSDQKSKPSGLVVRFPILCVRFFFCLFVNCPPMWMWSLWATKAKVMAGSNCLTVAKRKKCHLHSRNTEYNVGNGTHCVGAEQTERCTKSLWLIINSFDERYIHRIGLILKYKLQCYLINNILFIVIIKSSFYFINNAFIRLAHAFIVLPKKNPRFVIIVVIHIN